MHIHLIAIGNKMPDWVNTAFEDFVRRFPQELKINSILLPLIKRGKNPDISRIVRDEGRKLLETIPGDSYVIALDVKGKKISTEGLSKSLANWMLEGRGVSIVIGGPDGLAEEVLATANLKLSLSDLTFPHTLIRIMLIEQLYRAWSILNNHPYHRA